MHLEYYFDTIHSLCTLNYGYAICRYFGELETKLASLEGDGETDDKVLSRCRMLIKLSCNRSKRRSLGGANGEQKVAQTYKARLADAERRALWEIEAETRAPIIMYCLRRSVLSGLLLSCATQSAPWRRRAILQRGFWTSFTPKNLH